jgi:hypothetical protein
MSPLRLTSVTIAALGATAALALPAVAAAAPTITQLDTSQKGKKVTVTVKTKGFQVDSADVGGKPKSGRGHEHFQMDGGKYDYPKYSGANGKLAVKLGVQGKYSPSVTNTVTYKGLPKGKHKVTVFLVKNDHSNYANKGAKKTITFRVK